MTVQLLCNVRAVTPGGLVEDATVATEDGVIVGVEGDRSYAGAEDGQGAFCLPGLVDPHCDAIEREISPRPTATFDVDFALRSLEQRFLGAGITTAYHGVSFSDEDGAVRSVEGARRLVEAIAGRRAEQPRLEHRILFRVPARVEGSVHRAASALVDLGRDCQPPLLSFEDHTPGQGQYRNLDAYRAAMRQYVGATDTEADAEIARRMAASRDREPVRRANLSAVADLASSGVRVLAHDCVDAAEIDDARGWGAAVAEFPVTMEAARRAREQGMPVVLGAPNVLLGGSHSGNVSAEAVITAGLCTGLASDYLPPSLLAAAFDLADRKVLPLHESVGLVTTGPAQAAAQPRRAVEVGAAADLILVVQQGRWPAVRRILPRRIGPAMAASLSYAAS